MQALAEQMDAEGGDRGGGPGDQQGGGAAADREHGGDGPYETGVEREEREVAVDGTVGEVERVAVALFGDPRVPGGVPGLGEQLARGPADVLGPEAQEEQPGEPRGGEQPEGEGGPAQGGDEARGARGGDGAEGDGREGFGCSPGAGGSGGVVCVDCVERVGGQGAPPGA
ncbi:hypothetical protein GCM10011583_63690 [Streptomyces camponoticapitis]|uniref:Uncharacterized protein n=1 Tax=Streptomyces camponoticapitis TaxID=1616125 RepID=A0ABQ2EUU2_9ACTN|nr:hypothetical protein GCM10011583_63690 [Streptomyces camponoticapitis]